MLRLLILTIILTSCQGIEQANEDLDKFYEIEKDIEEKNREVTIKLEELENKLQKTNDSI